MVTTQPFINEVRAQGTTATVELAGTPGDDLAGYRVSYYENVAGALTYILTEVIPAGTGPSTSRTVQANGVVTLPVKSLGTGNTAVAVALHQPNVSSASTAGLVEFVQVTTGSFTPATTGPATGLTPTLAGVAMPSSPGSVGRIGQATPSDKSQTTWAAFAAASFGLPNDGETLTVPVVPSAPTDTPGTPTPLGDAVAMLLVGDVDDDYTVSQCAQAGRVTTALAQRYTRGNGWTAGTPDDPIFQVLVAATARLAANPEQIDTLAGSLSARGGFDGWTNLERIILGSYRGQAG